MASIRSKLFNFMVRNQHLFAGRLRKEQFSMDTSIQEFRERCERGAKRYAKIPRTITLRAQCIEGINAEWLEPNGANPAKLVMYVHGGGYVSGSCTDHRGFVSKFANRLGVTNLTYEYRLAPEHPYPAALDDSIRVYQWLLENGYRANDIVIAGESAGGGLCLALLVALRDRGMALPAAAVAISPWADLTCSSSSYTTKNRVSPAPLNSWIVFSKHYVGNSTASSPYISPLFADLKALPPILINSGVDDELYEDGEKFYLKAKAAGVNIRFTRGKGMIHCYPLLAPMFPEATRAMDEIVGFVREQLGGGVNV